MKGGGRVVKKWVTSGVELVGVALIATGFALIDYRFGLIAAGFGLVALSVGAAR